MLRELGGWLLISSFALSGCQHAEPAVSPTLGKQREEFGDLSGPSATSDWTCVETTFPATQMFFPAGNAERRIYLKEMSDSAALLVMVKKDSAGQLHKGWKVWLKPAKPKQPPIVLGTLARFLHDSGWDMSDRKLLKPAMIDLGRVVSYAVYVTDITAGSLYCGFLGRDAVLAMPPRVASSPNVADVVYPKEKPWPHIGRDYPVTSWEIEDVKKNGAASEHRGVR